MSSHLSRDPAALALETDNPPLWLHAYHREALRPIGHAVAWTHLGQRRIKVPLPIASLAGAKTDREAYVYRQEARRVLT
jgi:hypothetical protein